MINRAIIGDIQIGNKQTDVHGYLPLKAFVSRTGVYQYMYYELPYELGFNHLSGVNKDGVINVFRSDKVVFSKESTSTLPHAPLTIDHPPEWITPLNYSKYAVGEASTDIFREDDKLGITLYIKTADGIAALEERKQISLGYKSAISRKEGKTEDGIEYQAIMEDILINHVALVEEGRAGAGCGVQLDKNNRLTFASDSAIKKNKDDDKPKSNPKLKDKKMDLIKTKIADRKFDLPVADADEISAVFDKAVQDGKDAIKELQTTHDEAITAKDAEIKEATDKVAELTDANSPEKQHANAVERQNVIDTAKICKVELKNADKSTTAELMTQILTTKDGKVCDEKLAKLKDATPETIRIHFDAFTDVLDTKVEKPDVLGDDKNGGKTAMQTAHDKVNNKFNPTKKEDK